jgi:hypothetical protein
VSTQIKLPYSRYIQLLTLTNVPDDTISDSFDRRSLRAPTPEYLNEVRVSSFGRMPVDVQSYYVAQPGIIDITKVPAEVNGFLVQQGFQDVLTNPEGFGAAKTAFDNSDLRMFLFSFLIAREPEKDIVKGFKNITKYDPHPDLLAFFKKYFCDMGYMDYTSWKEWIVELRSVNPFEYDIYRGCFDTRFPFDFVKFKIHAELSDQNPDELLKKLVSLTYYRALECFEAGIDTDHEMVQGWIHTFLKTYEKHTTLGSGRAGGEGDRGLHDDAVFKLEHVKHAPKSIREFGDNIRKIEATPVIIDLPKESD